MPKVEPGPGPGQVAPEQMERQVLMRPKVVGPVSDASLAVLEGKSKMAVYVVSPKMAGQVKDQEVCHGQEG